MKYTPLIGAIALASLFLAAASSAAQHGHAHERDDERRAMAEHCPWAQPEVEVDVEDTEDGIALTIRGEPEQEEELRRFADRVAATHERMGEHHDHRHMRGRGGMGQMMMEMPEMTVEADEVEGGARLEFRPRDPEDREAVREHVRQHAEMMRERRCPMRSPADDDRHPR